MGHGWGQKQCGEKGQGRLEAKQGTQVWKAIRRMRVRVSNVEGTGEGNKWVEKSNMLLAGRSKWVRKQ